MAKTSSLEKQLEQIIRDGIKNELPRSKTRAHRNGNGAPLTAWMAGACKSEPSKIIAVCEGKARYPYVHIGAGAKVLAQRISERFKVSGVQHAFILDYVLGHYRGASKEPNWWGGCRELRDFSDDLSVKTKFVLSDIACKVKNPRFSLPLSVLIDPRVTNLLLLIEMEEQLKLSKRRK